MMQVEWKLGPRWQGPYVVIGSHRLGSYHLKAMNGKKLPHPRNANHLRNTLLRACYVTLRKR